MVPRLDNDTINMRSRFDNNIKAEKTPGEMLMQILRDHEESIHDIRRNQIDINSFGDDPASGTVTVYNPIRQPILVTDILATWATAQNPVQNPSSATGTVATPGANAPIATIAVGAGTFTVQWGVEILTAAATVPDNFKIAFNGGTALSQSINGTPVGSYPNQIPVTVEATGAIQTLGVYSIAADATGTYKATIVIQEISTGAVAGVTTITMGGRTFQCNYASGLFLATSMHGLQLDNTSKANSATLTVTPAAACHLEIAGTADYRKVERL